MKFFILAVVLGVSSICFGSEKIYYTCTSNFSDFATIVVKHVILREDGSVSSTFILDVTDESSNSSSYVQDGDVLIGSDNTFEGPFTNGSRPVHLLIKMPTFPDYKPRASWLTDADNSHEIFCRYN